jgi:hypothetical protein
MRDSKSGLITHHGIAKLLNKEARRRRATRVPFAPLQIYVDPCSVCDLRCTFCPQSNWGTRKRGTMSLELYERVLEEVARLRPSTLNLFCFGESLLHPRIFDMVRRAVDEGLRVRIHTNAKSLDEAKAKALLESGLPELHFSFDTADAELYNRMRVRSDFELVKQNIVRLLELKKAGGYTHPTIFVQEIVAFRSGEKPRNSEAYRKLFEGYDVIFDARFMHNFAGGSSEKEFASRGREGDSQCAQIYKRLVVTFDGKIHACCLDAEGYNIIGDLTQGDTIASAWNGAAMQRLRRLTNERRLDGLRPCDTCDQLSLPQKPLKPRLLGRALWASLAGRASTSRP